jgi:threonine dehydrogenase-like Zn-dependent dehydrogenase
VVVDEITLVGSRCGNYPAGLRALSSGLVQVGEMVDSVFSLEQGLDAIERAGQPGVLKILVKP